MSEVYYGKRIPQIEKPANNPTVFEEGGTKDNGKTAYSTTSKFLFREINLFIPETIGVAISFLVVVLGVAFGYLFNLKEAFIIAAAVPVVIMVLLYMARFLLFMPNKHRFLTQRIMSSGAIRFSVDDASKGVIPFDRSPMTLKVKILNPKKNINFADGRPILTLREGAAENVSLSSDGNTSQQAKELNSVIDSIWSTAEEYTRYNLKKKEEKMQLLLLIMGGLTLALLGATIYLILQDQTNILAIAKAVVPGFKG